MPRLSKRRFQLKHARGNVPVVPEVILPTPPPEPSTSTSTTTPHRLVKNTSRSTKKLIQLPSSSSVTPSTSTTSTSTDGSETGSSTSTSATTRTVLDFSQVQKLIAPLSCPVCHCPSLCLSINENTRQGLALLMTVTCSTCKDSVSTAYTSTRTVKKKQSEVRKTAFAVNDCAIGSSLLCGLGPYSFNKLCEHLELPGIHPSTFNRRATKLFYSNVGKARQALECKIIKLIREAHGLQPGDMSTLNIAVSYDGSWLTRGHSSMIGVGCVIDTLTGYVVDFHVMSTFCLTCQKTGLRKKQSLTAAEYQKWYNSHKVNCDVNYGGSSAMMETEAASILWARSVEKFNLRYTKMVSDGDAKSFNHLKELKPYADITVEKEECVNHVRNLVVDCSKRGITLGGKGKGRLTQNTIRKLSIYYTRAIRKQKDVESMRNAILASLYHGFSSDSRPLHHLCPKGEGSWCFYNASIARNCKPSSHSSSVLTPLNYSLLHQHLKPIYRRLSDPKLVERCLLGVTQNANESLHHSIWTVCSKNRYASKKKAEFHVLASVGEFNFGHMASDLIKESIGLSSLHHSRRLGEARLRKRISDSLSKQENKVKKRLQMRREAGSRR